MFYSAFSIFDIVCNDSIPRFTSRQSARFLKGLSRHVAVCISEREWFKCAEGKIGVIPFMRTMPPNPIFKMIALNAVLASARRFEGPSWIADVYWSRWKADYSRAYPLDTKENVPHRSPAAKGWRARRRVDEAWYLSWHSYDVLDNKMRMPDPETGSARSCRTVEM